MVGLLWWTGCGGHSRPPVCSVLTLHQGKSEGKLNGRDATIDRGWFEVKT